MRQDVRATGAVKWHLVTSSVYLSKNLCQFLCIASPVASGWHFLFCIIVSCNAQFRNLIVLTGGGILQEEVA